MKKFEKGNFYLIGDKNQKKLVLILNSRFFWITSYQKKELAINAYKSIKLDSEQALNEANKEIKYLKKMIADLKLHEADQRGTEAENIKELENKIKSIEDFKVKFIFQKPPG